MQNNEIEKDIEDELIEGLGEELLELYPGLTPDTFEQVNNIPGFLDDTLGHLHSVWIDEMGGATVTEAGNIDNVSLYAQPKDVSIDSDGRLVVTFNGVEGVDEETTWTLTPLIESDTALL